MRRVTEEIPLMSPAPGTSRKLVVHRYGRPGDGPKVYMQASLHADEWPGLIALQKLIPMLDKAAEEDLILGEIIVLPYANPIGMAQQMGGYVPGRYAFDGSGNFNRNWPDFTTRVASILGESGLSDDDAEATAQLRDALRKAVGEMPRRTPVQELRATLMSLSIDSDYVLDIHCDLEALLHVYANEGHRDIASVLSAELGAPVTMLDEEAAGGSFDEANMQVWKDLGKILPRSMPLPMATFSTTVELRGQGDVAEAFAESDAKGIFRFLQHQGIIGGDLRPVPELINPPVPLSAVDLLETPVAGIVGYHAELGDWVKKGQLMATVYDPASADPASSTVEIRAGTDGLFFSRLVGKLVQPGERLGKIAGETPLSYRQSGSLLED